MPADPARQRQAANHHLQHPHQAAMAQPLGDHQRTAGQRTEPFQPVDIVLRSPRSGMDIKHGKASL